MYWQPGHVVWNLDFKLGHLFRVAHWIVSLGFFSSLPAHGTTQWKDTASMTHNIWEITKLNHWYSSWQKSSNMPRSQSVSIETGDWLRHLTLSWGYGFVVDIISLILGLLAFYFVFLGWTIRAFFCFPAPWYDCQLLILISPLLLKVYGL